MKKFNHRDFVIDTELITTRDGSIIGHMVDWNSLRKFQEEEILEGLDITLPWGEELDFFEYINFIEQKIFEEYPELLTNYYYEGDFSFANMKFVEEAKSIYDVYIEFPERDTFGMDDLIDKIFDICEVPKGTVEEESLPVDLQYWPSTFDNEDEDYYTFIAEHDLKVDNFKSKIETLRNEINQESDALKKKSMLLTCLILVESLVSSVIVEKMPNIDSSSIKDSYHRQIVQESIISSLRDHKGRNRLFKQYFGSSLPQQTWIKLRNSLAHDIDNTILNDNTITIDSDITFNVTSVIDKIINFSNELSEIID